MNGVEILASNEVAVGTAFNWTLFWIIFSAVLIITTAIGVYEYISNQCDFGIVPALLIVGAFGGISLGGVIGVNCGSPTEYVTQYKVIVDDSVSMNDFVDKYEIVDQDGKIYIVRERE